MQKLRELGGGGHSLKIEDVDDWPHCPLFFNLLSNWPPFNLLSNWPPFLVLLIDNDPPHFQIILDNYRPSHTKWPHFLTTVCLNVYFCFVKNLYFALKICKNIYESHGMTLFFPFPNEPCSLGKASHPKTSCFKLLLSSLPCHFQSCIPSVPTWRQRQSMSESFTSSEISIFGRVITIVTNSKGELDNIIINNDNFSKQEKNRSHHMHVSESYILQQNVKFWIDTK